MHVSGVSFLNFFKHVGLSGGSNTWKYSFMPESCSEGGLGGDFAEHTAVGSGHDTGRSHPPPLHILRSSQLDAGRLDTELITLLREQLNRVFSMFNPVRASMCSPLALTISVARSGRVSAEKRRTTHYLIKRGTQHVLCIYHNLIQASAHKRVLSFTWIWIKMHAGPDNRVGC